MSDACFDNLTRTLGTAATRRRAVSGLAAAVATLGIGEAAFAQDDDTVMIAGRRCRRACLRRCRRRDREDCRDRCCDREED